METIQELIAELANKHGRSRESLLPVLQGVLDQEKYLSEKSMVEIARELDLPAAEVYGTATFYSFLDHQKMGKYVIRVCKTISCAMKGKNQIMLALQDMLNITAGQTTPDGRFSLVETNCLGWCHEGPAMLINEKPFSGLTSEKIHEIISQYMNK